MLQATPTIIDTWHEIPMTSSESGISEDDEVSNWIKYKDYFPTLSAKGPVNIVPGDLSEGSNRNRMPHGVKVCFSEQDKNFEHFLAAPALVKGNKVQVEGSYCRGPSQVKVNVDKNVVKTEKLAGAVYERAMGSFICYKCYQIGWVMPLFLL